MKKSVIIIFYIISSIAYANQSDIPIDCYALDIKKVPELSILQIKDFFADYKTKTFEMPCFTIEKLKNFPVPDNYSNQYKVTLKTKSNFIYQEIFFPCGIHSLDWNQLEDSYIVFNMLLKYEKRYNIYIIGSADIGGHCKISQWLDEQNISIPSVQKHSNGYSQIIINTIYRNKITNSDLPLLRANYIYKTLKDYLNMESKIARITILKSTVTNNINNFRDRNVTIILTTS